MKLKTLYQRYCNTPLKRVFFWMSSSFFAFCFLLGISIFLLQDKIIQRFISEVNQHLAVKVDAGTIDVTALPNFPNVSIAFDKLLVYESYAKPDTLAYFNTLYFTFNFWDLVDGNYQLQQLYAEKGTISLKINPKGIRNFEVTKKVEQTTSNDSHFDFHLNRIRLKDITFQYDDHLANQHYALEINDINSKFSYYQERIETLLEGDFHVQELLVGSQPFARQKDLNIALTIGYQLQESTLTIHPSSLSIDGGVFSLEGKYQTIENKHLALKLAGKNANFNTLLAFSPKAIRQQLAPYKTKGKAYFNAQLEGNLSGKQQPSIEVEFGCQDVSLSPPDYPVKISKLAFKGYFSNGNKRSLTSTIVRLDSIQGLLNQEAFEGRFSMKNFNSPYINAALKTRLNLSEASQFYPVESIETSEGIIDLDVQLNGNINTKWNVKASGTIGGSAIVIKPTTYPHAVRLDSLQLTLKQSQLSIQHAKGTIADSDFELLGNINHWHKLLTGNWQATHPQLRFKSQKLDFNQLIPSSLATTSATPNTTQALDFPTLDLSLQVNELDYEQWKLSSLTGKIKTTSEGQIRLNTVDIGLFGGNIQLNGLIEYAPSTSLYAGTVDLKGVNVTTLFQQFNDFDLDAISYKNLAGELNAHLAMELVIDEGGEIMWESMDAVLVGTIKDGQLINYEPMQRLATFMHNKNLENIRFSELSDTIFINNNQLTLPRMEIKSSVGNIFISGTQEIDGAMEYHLQVPLKNFKKPDKDEAFGAIEDDGLGNGNLFLVISGTADNYKIGYDQREVVKKIKEDLKKEKKEFSSLFKKKQKEKQVGLRKDYF